MHELANPMRTFLLSKHAISIGTSCWQIKKDYSSTLAPNKSYTAQRVKT